MKNGDRKLTFEERVKIECLIQESLSNNEIAKRLRRSPSSITREINSNKAGPQRAHYKAKIAQDLADCRQRIAAKANPRKKEEVWQYVESKIKLGWSPEIISGRIGLDEPDLSVSHEAIYQYVYSQPLNLSGYLARRRFYRRPKGPRKAKRSNIPNRLSIAYRPEVINQRLELGHWEADSVVCSQTKESLNVLVERLSRFVQITKIANLTARETEKTIVERLEVFEPHFRRSITYDNGFENKNHEMINQTLKTSSYFCEPYHSWEKGSVEQVNGLIRRYIPKKMDLALVTEADIAFIENQLNNRPRKCLGFKTPQEIVNTFL